MRLPDDQIGGRGNKNLNTILLTATLGLLIWLCRTTYDNSLALASMMPRQEIELRIREVLAQQVSQEAEIVELKLKVTSLELTYQDHLERQKLHP